MTTHQPQLKKKSTSAFGHILTLIQDGHLTHAQALVEAEEAQIDFYRDELCKALDELAGVQAELDSIKKTYKFQLT